MAKPKRDKDGGPEQETTFEKDLEQLEGIVNALEEGGLSLDESLKRFEDGIQLARRCEKALTAAEKRIEILLKNADGELEPQPFGEGAPASAVAPAVKRVEAKSVEADSEPEPAAPDEEEEDGELLF